MRSSLSAPPFFSQQNTDQSAAALVDNTAERFGKLRARIVGNMRKLIVKTFIDKLIERFAEHIGIPDLTGIGFKFTEQKIHKLLGLLFRANDGRYLRFNIGFDAYTNGEIRITMVDTPEIRKVLKQKQEELGITIVSSRITTCADNTLNMVLQVRMKSHIRFHDVIKFMDEHPEIKSLSV